MGKHWSDGKYKANCKCTVCGKAFYCPPCRIAIGSGKFCSYKCMGAFKKGKKDANLTFKLPKGHKPWNTGLGDWQIRQCLTCAKEFKTLASQDKKYCSKQCFAESLRIKDESLMSYGTLHTRVKELFGKPSKCENCGTTQSKKFEWANLSGEYKLERSDWARLCCVCHRRFDFGTKNKIEICV